MNSQYYLYLEFPIDQTKKYLMTTTSNNCTVATHPIGFFKFNDWNIVNGLPSVAKVCF